MTQTSLHRYFGGSGQTKLADFDADHKCSICGIPVEKPTRHLLEEHPNAVEDRLTDLDTDSTVFDTIEEIETSPVTTAGDQNNNDDVEDDSEDQRPVSNKTIESTSVQWEGESTQTYCENCERPVSKDYARVFSPERNASTVPTCAFCASRSERY